MNITPDQFQTTVLAWISAGTIILVALAGAIAKVWAVIKDLRDQINKLNVVLSKLAPPPVPADHPILQPPHKQHVHKSRIAWMLLMLAGLALSGCSLAQKSNNGSLSGTGFYYDSATGRLGAGILHASLLTHKDGTPAQMNVQVNGSKVPFDSTMSSITAAINFGTTVSGCVMTVSGTTVAIQFAETK